MIRVPLLDLVPMHRLPIARTLAVATVLASASTPGPWPGRADDVRSVGR